MYCEPGEKILVVCCSGFCLCAICWTLSFNNSRVIIKSFCCCRLSASSVCKFRTEISLLNSFIFVVAFFTKVRDKSLYWTVRVLKTSFIRKIWLISLSSFILLYLFWSFRSFCAREIVTRISWIWSSNFFYDSWLVLLEKRFLASLQSSFVVPNHVFFEIFSF